MFGHCGMSLTVCVCVCAVGIHHSHSERRHTLYFLHTHVHQQKHTHTHVFLSVDQSFSTLIFTALMFSFVSDTHTLAWPSETNSTNILLFFAPSASLTVVPHTAGCNSLAPQTRSQAPPLPVAAVIWVTRDYPGPELK